jgi:hypothetical protein
LVDWPLMLVVPLSVVLIEPFGSTITPVRLAHWRS